MRVMSILLVSALAAGSWGCFESATPLGPPDRQPLDRALLGSWSCVPPEDDGGERATLEIHPFDDSQYYATWTEDGDVGRYRAYASHFKNALVLNVQDRHSKDWIFVRYAIDASGSLTLSLVDESKLPDSAKNLGAVRRRVADPALYSTFASCTPDTAESADERVRTAVTAALRSLEAAERALDAEAVLGHFADVADFHVYDDGTALTYGELAAQARRALPALAAIEGGFADVRVVVLGPDAALSTARFRETVTTKDGETAASRGTATWLWRLMEGAWRITYGQIDREPAPQP
jgi:ketosteroid isomerase-like protein